MRQPLFAPLKMVYRSSKTAPFEVATVYFAPLTYTVMSTGEGGEVGVHGRLRV